MECLKKMKKIYKEGWNMEWKKKLSEEYDNGLVKIDVSVDNLGFVMLEKKIDGNERTIVLNEFDIARYFKALHDHEKFDSILQTINNELYEVGVKIVRRGDADGEAEADD